MGAPKLPDLATLIQAGIDPKTGLPLKLGNASQMNRKLKITARRVFRIIDEQRAVNRYRWYNLPAGLSSQELERLLYLKYQLVFFYMEKTGKFYFMPFALDGTIDFYGRYNTVHPVPMTSGSEKEKESKRYKEQAALLSTVKLNIVKDVVVYAEEITDELLTKSGVILRDYSPQMGQNSEPRYILNDDLIDMEADCLAFLRTSLLLGTGIQGLRVPDADAASEVDRFAAAMYSNAINGNPYTAITAKVELQEIQPASTLKASEFFLAMKSIDNLLLSTYGLDNSGVFNKQAHTLESENAVNYSNNALVDQDGLNWRQNFCNIVNSIWDLGMWCEKSEITSGVDIDGNGVPYDENSNGSGSGYSTEEGGEE